jgi:hypothetical protein
MSKIGAQTSGLNAQTPWDDQAASEVRELRRAITDGMSQEKISNDVAPMMAELLARLDTFVAGEPRSELAPPTPPNVAEPPSLHEAAAALSRAGGKIRQMAQGAGDPATQASLNNMIKVLDEHLAMRQEVLMRAEMP